MEVLEKIGRYCEQESAKMHDQRGVLTALLYFIFALKIQNLLCYVSIFPSI